MNLTSVLIIDAAMYISNVRSNRTFAEKIRDSLEATEGCHYELEEIEATIKIIDEMMEKIRIVIVAISGVVIEASQHVSEALQSVTPPQFQFEDIQSLEEIMVKLAEEYANVDDALEQKTKVSYKNNIMLQNRRYKTQMKVMGHPIRRRKFFVRKLP